MNTVILDRLVLAHSETVAAFESAKREDIWPGRISGDSELQIGIGIEKLAKMAGQEIKAESYDSPEYPVKKSFVYHGIMFFELGAESVETEMHDGTESGVHNAE